MKRRFLPYFLLLILCLFQVAVWAQDETPTPVGPEQLQGTALKLPLGLVEAPGPGWTWYQMPDAYLALSPGESDDVFVVVYMADSGAVTQNQVEMIVRSQMFEGSEEQKKAARIDVRAAVKPVFGQTFDFDYEDAEGPHSGSLSFTKGHALFILTSGKNGRAVRDKAPSLVKANAAVLAAKPEKAVTFYDKTEPVPARLLEGSTLRLVGGSLQAPAGWEWRELNVPGAGKAYVCLKDETSLVVVINTRGKADLHDIIDQFGKGVAKQSGGNFENKATYSPASLPFPNSEKVELTVLMDEQPVMTGSGYLGKTSQQSLAIFGLGLEPPNAAVESITRSFEEDLQPLPSPAVGIFFFGLLCVAFGAVVNKVSGRPRLNAAKFALVITVLAMGASVLMAWKAGPEELGRAIGGYFIPMLVFSLVASRHDKARAAWLDAQEQPGAVG